MITCLKLKPAQKGTKVLAEKYGDALISVRYRYDENIKGQEHKGSGLQNTENVVFF